jgi:hypothetical protein
MSARRKSADVAFRLLLLAGYPIASQAGPSAQLTATAMHLRDEARAKLTPQRITEIDRRVAERKIAQAR